MAILSRKKPITRIDVTMEDVPDGDPGKPEIILNGENILDGLGGLVYRVALIFEADGVPYVDIRKYLETSEGRPCPPPLKTRLREDY